MSLEPLTGRTHQLRVHCNELGTPILGDGKYGDTNEILNNIPKQDRQLKLHAKGIRIPNPDGGTIEIIAPLPNHMIDTLRLFGFNENQAGDLFIKDDDN